MNEPAIVELMHTKGIMILSNKDESGKTWYHAFQATKICLVSDKAQSEFETLGDAIVAADIALRSGQ